MKRYNITIGDGDIDVDDWAFMVAHRFRGRVVSTVPNFNASGEDLVVVEFPDAAAGSVRKELHRDDRVIAYRVGGAA